jgi:hypothetical protein
MSECAFLARHRSKAANNQSNKMKAETTLRALHPRIKIPRRSSPTPYFDFARLAYAIPGMLCMSVFAFFLYVQRPQPILQIPPVSQTTNQDIIAL